jgi:hypothetical protein
MEFIVDLLAIAIAFIGVGVGLAAIYAPVR